MGWGKVASLLVPGGVFALFAHTAGMRDEIDWELLRVWHEVVPGSAERWKPLDEEALWAGVQSRLGNVSELWSWLTYHDLARPEAADLFTDVGVAREESQEEVSADDYLARLRTSNYYLHLPAYDQQRLDERLRAVLDAHGGMYASRTNAVLVTARRSG